MIGLLAAQLIAAAAHADDAAHGGELAHALCAECHLNPGQGEKHGPMGVPGFAAVANRPLQTFDGIVDWLKSVPPMMPNHSLTQDEMYDLAAYIMSLRKTP
jgi:mono/diheme cytochrome c family protein